MFNLLKRYQFKPNYKLLTLGLFFLPVLIALGIWQLQRADYKQRLQDQYNARAIAAPVSLGEALSIDNKLFLPVQLRGTFDHHHVIFLDNRLHNHQPGYQVLMAFNDISTTKNVLINLGWIAQGPDRQHLPNIGKITQPVTIHGMINDFPKHTFTLGKLTDTPSTAWPLRLQQPKHELIQQKLGYPLLPFMVVLAPDEPLGYARTIAPSHLNPQMHTGYAFQWFALATTLVILLLVSSFKRKDKDASSH